MKIRNHNYVIVCYDIGEKRVNKIFKICKKYLPHYQYSIFKGPITPAKLILLKKELQKAINKDEDCVSIIKLQSESSFDEEILGCQKDENTNSLII
ncbi:CRISPR-associated endonuclease Cas2 [Thomasclavelia saccharogumia]|uniref:CRISPR-associated endonuclease Cas2 n=1 Tax=Thomasclavelia saccharogumia TaxID=341225 RepID=UPI00047B0D7A|nr:CRISPR-associated endonuclease Cas2 [Thomasclavelia saccharogumia]